MLTCSLLRRAVPPGCPALTDALAGRFRIAPGNHVSFGNDPISAPAAYAEILTPLSGLIERCWVQQPKVEG